MHHHTTGSIQRRMRSNHFGLPSRWLGSLGCALLLGVSSAGCTWVPLAPEAEGIDLASDERAVAHCKLVGNISTRTKTKVGFIGRNPERISDELTTLAKNEAVEMDADTIVAVGKPTLEGVQKFRAYHCPPS
jgi:hypothetical protein